MEYYVTFSDGSSAYLEHFGVKGMHWGVRNQETQMKYAVGNGGQVSRSGGSPYSAGIRGRLNTARQLGQTASYVAYKGVPRKMAQMATTGMRNRANSVRSQLPSERKRIANVTREPISQKKAFGERMMDSARSGDFGLAGKAYAKAKDAKASGVVKPKKSTRAQRIASGREFANRYVAAAVNRSTHPIKTAKSDAYLIKTGVRSVSKKIRKSR